jgi:hypothetical protein
MGILEVGELERLASITKNEEANATAIDTTVADDDASTAIVSLS